MNLMFFDVSVKLWMWLLNVGVKSCLLNFIIKLLVLCDIMIILARSASRF